MKPAIAYSLAAASLVVGFVSGLGCYYLLLADAHRDEAAGAASPHQARARQILKLKHAGRQGAEMKDLAAEWSESNPEEALEFRESIAARPEIRESFDLGAMPVFARTRPEFVIQQIAADVAWPDRWEQERDALLALAEERPRWVADRILAGEPGFQPRPTVVRGVARSLAREDPEGALEFASAMEEEDARKFGWVGLAHEWAQSDPYATATWLVGLEKGETRDAVVASYVRGIAGALTEEAWEWALSIDGPEQRLGALTSVLNTARARRAAEEFRAKIAASELDDDLKKSLLALLEGH